jgi:MFS family permease
MIDWLGEVKLARLGLVFLSLGLVAVSRIYTYPTMLVALTLMPVGTAFLFPCVTAMLSRVVHKRDRGLYMGVQHTFGGVSRVAFPLMAGYGMDVLGKGVPFVIAGVLVMLTLLLTIAMEDYAQPPIAASPQTAA